MKFEIGGYIVFFCCELVNSKSIVAFNVYFPNYLRRHSLGSLFGSPHSFLSRSTRAGNRYLSDRHVRKVRFERFDHGSVQFDVFEVKDRFGSMFDAGFQVKDRFGSII